MCAAAEPHGDGKYTKNKLLFSVTKHKLKCIKHVKLANRIITGCLSGESVIKLKPYSMKSVYIYSVAVGRSSREEDVYNLSDITNIGTIRYNILTN